MASTQMTAQTRQKVKDEITKILIHQAGIKKTIYYGELCRKIKNFKLMPKDEQLNEILGDISAESYRAKKGLLSVFVVEKAFGMPGDGFFILAKKLGCRIITEEQFFKDQIDFVHSRYRDSKISTI